MEIKFKFLVIQCSLPEFVMKDHKGFLLGYQMTKKFENLHSPKTAYRCEKKKKKRKTLKMTEKLFPNSDIQV